MKGIAIISVVLGHCAPNHFIESFVNQYHLAIFFFVSGYFFNPNYIVEKKNFIKRKVKSLYIPYVISGIIFMICHPLLEMIHIYDKPLLLNEYPSVLFDLCIRLTSAEPLMGAMWFCPALLFVSIYSLLIFYLTKKCSPKTITIFFALIAFVGGGINYWFSSIKSPYCIWQYLLITFIYFCGFKFKNIEVYFKDNMIKLLVIIIAVFIIILTTRMEIFARLQPNHMRNENPFTIIFIALIGCIGIFNLSLILGKQKIFKNIFGTIGNYSFSIMLLHFLSFKLVNFLICLFYGYDFNQISSFPCITTSDGWWCIYWAFGIFIPIILSYMYHHIKNNFLCYVRGYNHRL